MVPRKRSSADGGGKKGILIIQIIASARTAAAKSVSVGGGELLPFRTQYGQSDSNLISPFVLNTSFISATLSTRRTQKEDTKDSVPPQSLLNSVIVRPELLPRRARQSEKTLKKSLSPWEETEM